MKQVYRTMVVLLVFAAALSCRKVSDPIGAYCGSEYFRDKEASKSLTSQFKEFWTSMNSNYNSWDEELTYGIDWDEVYQKYLPIFEQLDREYNAKDNPIPDEKLSETYGEFINTLHNGHLYVEIKNNHTDTRLTFSPRTTQICETIGSEHYGRESSFEPDLSFYEALPETDQSHFNVFDGGFYLDLPDGDEYLAEYIQASLIYDISAIPTYYPMFRQQFSPEEAENYQSFYENFVNGLTQAEAIFETDKTPTEKLQEFYAFYTNNLKALEEDQINEYVMEFKVPVDGSDYSLTVEEPFFQELGSGILLKSALVGGNIAYFWCNSFKLNTFLDPESLEHYCQSRTMTFLLRRAAKCWQKWFDDIQRLSAEGKLKGVIIDLRCNVGGLVKDFQYFSGALTNNRIKYGYYRVKEGPGRFDYSPLVPEYSMVLPQKHAEVTCPIVVLCNHVSASMSEHVALTISEMPNGIVVGTNTVGALGAINGSYTLYSTSYSGCVGKKGEGSYCIMNSLISFFDNDKKCLEAKGLMPKEENSLEMDYDMFWTNHRDNQLEKALQIITGK